MDPKNLPTPSPRKVKFRPKPPPPPRRSTPPVAAASQEEDVVLDDGDEETARSLSQAVDKHLGLRSRRSKVAKRAVEEIVALTHGGGPSTGLRSWTRTQSENADDESSAAKSEEAEEALTVEFPDLIASTTDPTAEKKKKEYREPWDYENSYYPTTLPMRRPYSGNPELLDKEEFEDPPQYDERTINSAKALGLLDGNDEQRMFLVQLPLTLPIGASNKAQEKPATSKGKEKVTGIPKTPGVATDTHGKKASGSSTNRQGSDLATLPEGRMGKLLVYKSGRVKWKLGDVLYDVDPGTISTSAQSDVAINKNSKDFIELGELDQRRMVVTPDIEELLKTVD